MSNRIIGARQTTIASDVELHGAGVHSGAPASILLQPAGANTGLRFLVKRDGVMIADIPAHVRNVKALTLCTVLGDETGVTVSTVEHLLAALRGLSIDNCLIVVEGKEIPIMDGSSAPFVEAIEAVGVRQLLAPRRYVKVLKTIRVEDGESWGEFTPHTGFRLDLEIDFDTPLIGNQRIAFEMSPAVFRDELCHARTFGFMRDVEALWKAGLALGADLTNCVAIGDGRVMNPEGLRDPREFVRHKMLDAVGDLALAGYPLLAKYRSVRGGHKLNSSMLKALFADRSAWTMVEAPRVRQPVARTFEMSVAAE